MCSPSTPLMSAAARFAVPMQAMLSFWLGDVELDIIAVVVIGGGSLNGGRGSVMGTISGALLMQVIRHGCRSIGVPTAYEQIIIGVIVIVAVTLDQIRQRRLDR